MFFKKDITDDEKKTEIEEIDLNPEFPVRIEDDSKINGSVGYRISVNDTSKEVPRYALSKYLNKILNKNNLGNIAVDVIAPYQYQTLKNNIDEIKEINSEYDTLSSLGGNTSSQVKKTLEKRVSRLPKDVLLPDPDDVREHNNDVAIICFAQYRDIPENSQIENDSYIEYFVFELNLKGLQSFVTKLNNLTNLDIDINFILPSIFGGNASRSLSIKDSVGTSIADNIYIFKVIAIASFFLGCASFLFLYDWSTAILGLILFIICDVLLLWQAPYGNGELFIKTIKSQNVWLNWSLYYKSQKPAHYIAWAGSIIIIIMMVLYGNDIIGNGSAPEVFSLPIW